MGLLSKILSAVFSDNKSNDKNGSAEKEKRARTLLADGPALLSWHGRVHKGRCPNPDSSFQPGHPKRTFDTVESALLAGHKLCYFCYGTYDEGTVEKLLACIVRERQTLENEKQMAEIAREEHVRRKRDVVPEGSGRPETWE